ncbi:MAG: hypothetical protein IPM57_10520 [Oligoflexia bacterium]|nr:hypothetical protein [Oligoflexia bacterium]
MRFFSFLGLRGICSGGNFGLLSRVSYMGWQLILRKTMNKIRLLLMFSFLFLLTTGFQIFTNRDFWNINNSSAASRKLFIRYSGGTEQYNNNLPASDVLAASGATVTLDAIINSVLNDYNAIGSSYVQLVLTSDSDFCSKFY